MKETQIGKYFLNLSQYSPNILQHVPAKVKVNDKLVFFNQHQKFIFMTLIGQIWKSFVVFSNFYWILHYLYGSFTID